MGWLLCSQSAHIGSARSMRSVGATPSALSKREGETLAPGRGASWRAWGGWVKTCAQ